jgi:hypothetical protein
MGVVGNAADGECLHAVGPRNSAHVRPEPVLQVFRNARDSVLGRKYTMKQQGGVRVVGHKRLIVASAVPTGTLSFVNAYPALERLGGRAARALGVPGYSQSRLTALQALANRDLLRVLAGLEDQYAARFAISLTAKAAKAKS